MTRQPAAGSMIVDELRDRIVSGLYLGRWQSGERLPSIRDVAEGANVDRKTAAAAYRRLQLEGLVRVRPRSGVYLRGNGAERKSGPLERLHRRWLENSYEGARTIGLDTATMLRLIQSVAHVERQQVPVLESDATQARVIAEEAADRVAINCVPRALAEADARDPLIASAPFFITTPYHTADVARIANGRTVVEVSCAREIVDHLRELHGKSGMLIVAPTEVVADRIRRALQHGQIVGGETVVAVEVESDHEGLRRAADACDQIMLWPGASPAIRRELAARAPILPRRCLATETVQLIRHAILDAAMRHAQSGKPLSTSSGDAPRARTAADVS